MKRNFGHEDAGLATPESLGRIVKNFNIRAFLETNDKRYIVGPKGSGKTLLLLRKAIDQRERGDGLCIPSETGYPVDRLTAAQHVGKSFNRSVSDTAEANLAWTSVWKHSIYRSVVHHVRDSMISGMKGQMADDGEGWQRELEFSRLKSVRDLLDRFVPAVTPFPRGPFYYYTELAAKLDAMPKARDPLHEVRDDMLGLENLVHIMRQPVYVFLDNLDDYYENEPELWFNSMYGQFRAIREIGLTHRNIHVFTSIRQDVYEQFADEMRLQYYDYVAHLNYTKKELLSIFESHIQDLDDDLLSNAEARKKDPWRAFFGDCVVVRNEFVGVDEDIWDYIHRHTLGRPRDMIHMGTVLLAQRPAEGFDIETVRHAVFAAEQDVAQQYLDEIRPLLHPKFDIGMLIRNYVTSNLLTRQDLRDIRDRYVESRDDVTERERSAQSNLTRPFETLYELGLLGYAREKHESTQLVQDFRMPGQGVSEGVAEQIPRSDFYFIHPILSNWLPHGRRSGRIVIGNQLPCLLS